MGPRPHPDLPRLSHREYGHRVGIFRILDALANAGITPTIAMDAMTAEHYPFLVRYCLDRGCEIIGHGLSASRLITSRMNEGEERQYISASITALERATGARPRGWLGSAYGESSKTPQLLAEAGIHYVCDWVNDEQPYPLQVSAGELYALPVTLELDDVHALWTRRVSVERFARTIVDIVDILAREGEPSGRVAVANLHPWLSGQAFRIGAIERALASITAQPHVWAATGGEIIEWYREHVDRARA